MTNIIMGVHPSQKSYRTAGKITSPLDRIFEPDFLDIAESANAEQCIRFGKHFGELFSRSPFSLRTPPLGFGETWLGNSSKGGCILACYYTASIGRTACGVFVKHMSPSQANTLVAYTYCISNRRHFHAHPRRCCHVLGPQLSLVMNVVFSPFAGSVNDYIYSGAQYVVSAAGDILSTKCGMYHMATGTLSLVRR